MKLISITILSLFAMMNCSEEHPIFKKHTDIITNAKEVTLSEISAQPTQAEEQDKSKEYIYEYEVIKKDTLSEDLAEQLKTAVIDADSYVLDAKKTCPMTAKYALTFIKKKKHSITLIISEGACEKVIVHSTEKDLKPTYLDLKEQNQIIALIRKFKMP